MKILNAILLLSVALLSACGGGGEGGTKIHLQSKDNRLALRVQEILILLRLLRRILMVTS